MEKDYMWPTDLTNIAGLSREQIEKINLEISQGICDATCHALQELANKLAHSVDTAVKYLNMVLYD